MSDPKEENVLAPGEGAPDIEISRGPLVVAPGRDLAPVRARTRGKRWARAAVLLLLLAAGGVGGFYYWRSLQSGLPAGIAFGNGRLESDEIDIATKFAGRIAELRADEGDMVTQGQIVARMDTSDLEASLAKSQSLLEESRRSLQEAKANLEAQQAQATLASQELDRTTQLVKRGFATYELLDQRREASNAAQGALAAARERVAEAERAIDAAVHDAEFYRVNIADNSLRAPKEGRIQYRIANVGEVLPAGGRVFTMLDISYVYMDIYLPTLDAGKTKIGADARITLDAVPGVAVPAKVSFVATQAQFTPKTVETKDERDKLMFRVRLKIDPDLLRAHAQSVRSGLPGLGYVKTDAAVAWPEKLQGKASK